MWGKTLMQLSILSRRSLVLITGNLQRCPNLLLIAWVTWLSCLFSIAFFPEVTTVFLSGVWALSFSLTGWLRTSESAVGITSRWAKQSSNKVATKPCSHLQTTKCTLIFVHGFLKKLVPLWSFVATFLPLPLRAISRKQRKLILLS